MERPIETIKRLYSELEALDREASNTLLDIKNAHREKEYTLERNGKKITLKEPVLWQEVLHLGADCQAGEILKNTYPSVFKKYAQQGEKAEEVREYVAKTLGFDFQKIRIVDIIKLIEFVLDERTASE